MKNTRPKIVIASGAIRRLWPWNVSRTRPSTNTTIISIVLCTLPGFSTLARRAMPMNSAQNAAASTKVKNSVSMLSVQNAPSPSFHCR